MSIPSPYTFPAGRSTVEKSFLDNYAVARCVSWEHLSAAREHAWATAERFAVLNEEDQQRAIEPVDTHVEGLGRFVLHPGVVLSGLLKVVRLGERNSIVDTLEILK